MIDLKKLRIEKNMTQEQLGEKIGVVRQVISNIECGISRPSIETAKLLAGVFGVEWAEFYTE